MKALRKYLELYADRTPIPNFPFPPVEYGILIPCFGEKEEILHQLRIWEKFSDSFLIVLIINEAVDSETWAKEVNQELIAELRKSSLTDLGRDFFANYRGVQLVVLDRTGSQSLTGGVGEARKIGADYLLKLRELGKLKCPFIFSTDADVIPPPDYFSSTSFFKSSLTAFHFNFEHWSPSLMPPPHMENYELSLRYYAWGLRTAGSAYCYPSIGSCLIIHLDAYVECRGFPQRKAGEDFYLLNKLRKLGPLCYLPQLPLRIKARTQLRTPFGTSAALQKKEDFLFFQPEVFFRLKEFLETSEKALINRYEFSAVESLWPLEDGLPDLKSQWDALINSSSQPTRRVLHFHTWFDGFKTLRFIQALTRQSFPKQDLPASIKTEVGKSLESPEFLNSLLELSLLDYSQNRVDQHNHGRSISKTRIHPQP